MVIKRLKRDRNNLIPEDKRPYFFKIVYAEHTTEHLRIPPHFLKHVSKELSDSATLKGPSGSCWNVKLRQSIDGTYLQDGWQEFLRDHSLGHNEFLLFSYDGNMCFHVQIFDKSGCERDGISVSRTHQESALYNGKRKRGRPRKTPLGSLHLHPSKSCRDGPGQHLPNHKSKKLKKFKEEKDTPRKIKTEYSDLPIQDMDSQLKKIKEEKNSQRKIKIEGMDLPVQEMDSHTRHCYSMKQPPTEEDTARVWEAAESFNSKFPYFKTHLKKSSVHKVFILAVPLSFSRTHFHLSKAKISLRNSKGEAWVVNSIPTGGKHFFCGGWSAFVRDNKLKQGDLCIFELVDNNEMQVHIFQDQGS